MGTIKNVLEAIKNVVVIGFYVYKILKAFKNRKRGK